MADFSAFYWSRHIFAGDRHWMDREAAVALKKLKMVSMPSRAYTSFLPWGDEYRVALGSVCQCPLGLIPHFYLPIEFGKAAFIDVSMPSRAYTSFLPWYQPDWKQQCSVSMPSRAYTSFLRYPLQKPRFYAVSRACFCRYLSEYSDNSRFSCMLTFWTYLMRYTYPWHWIKYSTKYNRCHPIFSLSW